MFPLVVHQPAFPSIWPAVQSLRRGISTNPGVTIWVHMWVQLKRECVSCVWMLQRRHSGDGCVLASTLCKYDLRKGNMFAPSWARVRRVRQGTLSSELPMCGGGMHSILSLPLVAKRPETTDACTWRMFVFMSAVVTVWECLPCSGRC